MSEDKELDTKVDTTKEDSKEELSPIEEKAREMGHVSVEEWEEQGKDPEEWIEAKEYVGRQPLYEGLHKANRKIKSQDKKMDAMVEYLNNVDKTAYDRALTDLTQQKKRAIAEEDLQQALVITDEIEDLKEKKPEPIQEDQDNSIFEDFVNRNSWYESNMDKTYMADGIANRMIAEAKQRGVAPNWEKVIEKVEESVKALDRTTVRGNSVEGSRPRGRSTSTSKKALTRDDLDDGSKKVYDEIVKTKSNPHGLISEENFFKNLGE